MEDRSSSPGADCFTSASCREDSHSSDASSTRPLTHATELIPTVDSFFVTDVVLSQVLLLCGVLAPLGLLMLSHQYRNELSYPVLVLAILMEALVPTERFTLTAI